MSIYYCDFGIHKSNISNFRTIIAKFANHYGVKLRESFMKLPIFVDISL